MTTIVKSSVWMDPKVWFLDPDVCDESVHEVQLAGDEVKQGALVSDTESDGKYPNHACQNWNIITDENRVYYLSKKITIASCVSTLHVVVTKPKIMHFITCFIYCNIFQCIIITVGNGGFNTEPRYDLVWFWDSNATTGMTLPVADLWFTIKKLEIKSTKTTTDNLHRKINWLVQLCYWVLQRPVEKFITQPVIYFEILSCHDL